MALWSALYCFMQDSHLDVMVGSASVPDPGPFAERDLVIGFRRPVACLLGDTSAPKCHLRGECSSVVARCQDIGYG